MLTKSIDVALSDLFSLRDKWHFYTSTLTGSAANPYPGLEEELDYAAKLWLVDLYYNIHDFLQKTLIAARKIPMKFPSTVKRDGVRREIIKRLTRIQTEIGETPNTSNLFLHLRSGCLKSSVDVAEMYFSDTKAFLSLLPQDELKRLWRKLSLMIIEEELPVTLS